MSPFFTSRITFMTLAVQRFVTELPGHVNELIGNQNAARIIEQSQDRVLTARVLYEQSLRRVVRFVRFFQLRDTSHQPIYDLFFATNHTTGHERMKEAMWKVDASGAYSFSDGADPNQRTLFSPQPGDDLAPLLWNHFRGRTVYTDEVYRHVADTAYLEKHARAALKILEDAGSSAAARIEVAARKQDGTKRRPSSFPPGVLVRFSPQVEAP
ncbi:MAG: hypothetical protein AAB113_11805 [Candidatus Eisenbacteria bacterium]